MNPHLKHKLIFILSNIILQFLALVLFLRNDMLDISYPGSDSGPGSSLTSLVFSLLTPFIILFISSVVWRQLKFKNVIKISVLTFLLSLVFWFILICIRLAYMSYSENKQELESSKAKSIVLRKNLDILINNQSSYKILDENYVNQQFDGYFIQQENQGEFLIQMSDRNDLYLRSTKIPPVNLNDSMAIHYYVLEAIKPFTPDSSYEILKSIIDSGFVSPYNPKEYRNFSSYKESKDSWMLANYSLDIYKRDTIFKIFLKSSRINKTKELESLFGI